MGPVDEIWYAWGPGQSRAALLADGEVVEFAVIRPDLMVGAVFLGRVVEVAEKIDAAFVDIGSERPAFLPGSEGLSQGDAVLVQVRADAQGGKGARLTGDVSLAGRWLAYSPTRPGLSVSRRLAEDEREALLGAVTPMLQPGEGAVLRTAAAGQDETSIRTELDSLRAEWAAIDRAKGQARAPQLIWRPDPLARLLADNPQVERVVIDDAATAAAARTRFGSLIETARDGSAFEEAGLEDDFAQALEPVVALPSGGRLVIERTAAVWAMDVDSGSGRQGVANREAVDEIARQLRLRNIAGQIVVDFISASARDQAQRLAGDLRRRVASDPIPTHVVGVSPLGLVEVTRERRGPSLAELMTVREAGASASAAAYGALARWVNESRRSPGRRLCLLLAPDVGAILMNDAQALAEAETRVGHRPAIRLEPGRARENVGMEEVAP